MKGTRRDAERRLAELQHQIDAGGFVKPSKLTLGAFLEQWLRDYARPNVGPTTYHSYEHMIRKHLIPALGRIPLSELKPQHLQSYYADKLQDGRLDGSGGLSPRTVHHHHVTLHDALQSAVKSGLVARNVADATDAPRFVREEMRTLDDDGLRRFLDAARETPYYTLFYISLFTAVRRSELLALRWDDIDLDMGQMVINRALHRVKRENFFRTPKSAKGRRQVALPPSAALVLRRHRDDTDAQRLALGLPEIANGTLVFTRPDGTPMIPDTLTHAWRKLARRSGFHGIRLHDARHTHATLMLKQGIHPKIVQERLGHATIATTLDSYSHVLPGMQEAAAQRFDDVAQGLTEQTQRESALAKC